MIQTAVTSSQNSFAHPVPATRNVTIRKSVYDLTDAEVLALREAYAAVQALPNTDYRGYQYVASIHGLNQYFCPHGNPFFAIWHRPYVLMFEQILQAYAPGLGLPYWDWTSDRAKQEGIPAIFAAPTYDDAAGKPVPNPLYKAAISFPNPSYTETVRNPGAPAALGRTLAMVQTAMRAPNYDRFTPALESPHNFVHGWVGGTMGQITYAAFDPVFWVHHCFVEKIFCDWQDLTNAPISPTIDGQILTPFHKTTNDVWNYKALGYRYLPEGSLTAPSPRPKLLAASAALPASAASFSLSRVPADLQSAHLNFIRTHVPKESFEVRVFFNENKPDVKTPISDNPRYAGSFFTFGHGVCTGGPGHCKVPAVPLDATQFAVLRPEHHLTPRKISLDVTAAVQTAKQGQSPAIDVQLVLVNPAGESVPGDELEFEMLTLDAV